jgi:hypothetical protein
MWNDLEVVLLDDELLLLEKDVDGLGLGQLLPALLGQDRLVVVVPAQLRDLRQAAQIFIRFAPVFRIRIRMFLGLPDPDPLVRGADPDHAPYASLYSIRC